MKYYKKKLYKLINKKSFNLIKIKIKILTYLNKFLKNH